MKLSAFASIGSAAICSVFSLPAHAQIVGPEGSLGNVKVNGKTYSVDYKLTNYNSEPAFFTTQPIWKNLNLTNAVATEVFSQFPVSALEGPGPGLLFGYDISGSSVSIVYKTDELVNCPEGCPFISDGYYYALITLLQALAGQAPAQLVPVWIRMSPKCDVSLFSSISPI